jgi:hypothetical protein
MATVVQGVVCTTEKNPSREREEAEEISLSPSLFLYLSLLALCSLCEEKKSNGLPMIPFLGTTTLTYV